MKKIFLKHYFSKIVNTFKQHLYVVDISISFARSTVSISPLKHLNSHNFSTINSILSKLKREKIYSFSKFEF